MVFVRNLPFFHFFFKTCGPGKYVYDILEPKKAFIAYKNKK